MAHKMVGGQFIANFNNGTDVSATDGDYFDFVVFRPEEEDSNYGDGSNNAVYGDGNAGYHQLTLKNTGFGPKLEAIHWDGSIRTVDTGISLNNWLMATVEHKSGTLGLRVNAGAEVSIAVGNQSASATADIGSGDLDGSFNAYRGQIAIRGMFPSGLSEADRQKLEGWLAHRTNLTSNLPIGHPYKSSPP